MTEPLVQLSDSAIVELTTELEHTEEAWATRKKQRAKLTRQCMYLEERVVACRVILEAHGHRHGRAH